MTTAIDTNVIAALLNQEDALNLVARRALDGALERATLVVPAPVYGELMAGRSEAFLDSFFRETAIQVDWNFSEAMWRTAGRAFQSLAARRRNERSSGPRRILTDFLIGAYALENGFPLLTLDEKHFRAGFPGLEIVNI